MSIEYPCVHWNEGKCKKFSDDKVTSWCVESPCEDQMPSNADCIRAMSDEELAEWLGEYLDCINCPVGVTCVHGNGCPGSLVDWLKQPSE